MESGKLLFLVLFILVVLERSIGANISDRGGRGRLRRNGGRSNRDRPNFLLIFADDMGWNDIGYHNSEVITPNLDQLAREGVELDRVYSMPTCTPSRAALLTGKYPFKIGLQNRVLLPGDPQALPLDLTLLQEVLQRNDYSTHLTGKWHLGACTRQNLPTNRGFDSFLGFLTGGVDPFTRRSPPVFGGATFYDFWNGTEILRIDDTTVYAQDLYEAESLRVIRQAASSDKPFFLLHSTGLPHTPLGAPAEYLNLYPAQLEPVRRQFLGMVSALDASVGRMVEELEAQGLRDNTLIVFMSDNGAPSNYIAIGDPAFTGSNYPLRNSKASLFDGGVRVPAFVNGPIVGRARGSLSKQLLHITDWMPTILSFAGIQSNQLNLDGKNQHAIITNPNAKSDRQELVIQIQDLVLLAPPINHNSSAALIWKDYKLLVGPAVYAFEPDRQFFIVGGSEYSQPDEWRVAGITKQDISGTPCGLNLNDICLFNLIDDPSETEDLSSSHSHIVDIMMRKLENYKEQIILPINSNLPVPPPVPADVFIDEDGNFKPGWCE